VRCTTKAGDDAKVTFPISSAVREVSAASNVRIDGFTGYHMKWSKRRRKKTLDDAMLKVQRIFLMSAIGMYSCFFTAVSSLDDGPCSTGHGTH